MNIMEVSNGRLTATLRAGKIPVAEETLAMLRAGLSTIGHGYHIEKCISTWAKSDTELKKDLARLLGACRIVVEVLDADIKGSGQIEAILSDFWNGSRIPQLVEQLRPLFIPLETAVAMAAQDGRIKKRSQTPETSFFLAVHDLFSALTGNRRCVLDAFLGSGTHGDRRRAHRPALLRAGARSGLRRHDYPPLAGTDRPKGPAFRKRPPL